MGLLDFFKKLAYFLLINKFLLFQYSEGIFSVSTKAITFKVAQNDHAFIPFLTHTKLEINSQRAVGKQRINIKTIENS